MFSVGGLIGQSNHAYLTEEFIELLKDDPQSLRFSGFRVGKPTARLIWKFVRHYALEAKWPPEGLTLEMDFVPSDEDPSFSVTIYYQLYSGIPAISKWLTIQNLGKETITVNQFTSEILAVVPYEDPVEWRDVPIIPPNLHVETDYAFDGFSHKNSSKHSVYWTTDPQFHTQVNYANRNPCLLEVCPPQGPAQDILPEGTFESFRAFELLYDSTDRERRGLALRRLYRIISPWITENPLILHVVSTNPETVRNAIDQASNCGFEMISLSFGSGINMEDENDDNYQKCKNLADYADSKGLHLGGYSLLSSRRIQPDIDNIVNPKQVTQVIRRMVTAQR